MATSTNFQPPKLGEFLQEQQEPFILEVYLSERGRVKKGMNSEANNSSNNRKKFPLFSKVLRAVYSKLLSRNKSSDDKHAKPRTTQEVAESDRFSSTSSRTVYNSFPESDTEEPLTPANHSQFVKFHDQRGNEADTDEKFQWRRVKDSKEHSPTSVLEPPCSRGFPIHNETEEFIFTKSASDLLQSATGKSNFAGSRELRELVWINPPSHSQYLISKKVLHQTKQLMFDCVRELVENRKGKERRGSNSKEVLGAEELRQLIWEKIKCWGKLSNMTQLLDSDFVHSLHEWSDFESERRDIGLELGDAILEDIYMEIVTDMNDLQARM
ncbi:hypothetical protein SLEP1_g30210 [Rubroshorea leprosula]|uniref:DUF4378 domain-containing protein n=1 Tax=Rubroshorea leprosula TaxID=152421 RepID=A0AAV5K539_9ROSI|nr:hypothetical protein SLEP1_g30210 [Rubroshorea leprosula]